MAAESTSSNASVGPQIEPALREFLFAVHSLLRQQPELFVVLAPGSGSFEEPVTWNRGSDGNFRRSQRGPKRILSPRGEKAIAAIPQYQRAVALLEADHLIGPQLNLLVGVWFNAKQVGARDILLSFVYKLLNREGDPQLEEEIFSHCWLRINELFSTQLLLYQFVIPLPGLILKSPPLRLSDNLHLDALNDEEVTRCHMVGVLQPLSPQFPLIMGRDAMGIRGEYLVPKWKPEDVGNMEQLSSETGSFGNRGPLHLHLVAEDVLSALRLLKKCGLRETGYAAWLKSDFLGSATSFRPQQAILRKHHPRYEIGEADAQQLYILWNELKQGHVAHQFGFRRFNFASDRDSIDDRIVDLVIAAESLLLNDVDAKYRGELKFRFCLRAAKFIESATYKVKQVYAIMSEAYDVRSTIVHGSAMPKKTRLPNNQDATPAEFADEVEELVRLGLRKALSMADHGYSLHKHEFWLNLILD